MRVGNEATAQQRWCNGPIVESGDLLEVKSGTTAIAGGVVSSIELFPYAEHQSESRRRSTDVCESRQVV